MKSNIKCRVVFLIVAFVGVVEVANAFYDPGLQRWINRDPISEHGSWNLFGFVQNGPTVYIDLFGLKFVYQGPYSDDYKRIIECWKQKLPEKSALREAIKELEESPRDIRITANTRKDVNGNPARPSTVPDKFDRGKGHDTTTYIDPQSYTYDGRTWTFPEGLAHELLHALYEQDPTKIPGKHHEEESWREDERKVTNDAKGVPCK
jgi:hypothetical protein